MSTNKDYSRGYAPIETNPLPKVDCLIDVKLNCGSVLINCIFRYYTNEQIYFKGAPIGEIKSWRLSK